MPSSVFKGMPEWRTFLGIKWKLIAVHFLVIRLENDSIPKKWVVYDFFDPRQWRKSAVKGLTFLLDPSNLCCDVCDAISEYRVRLKSFTRDFRKFCVIKVIPSDLVFSRPTRRHEGVKRHFQVVARDTQK